MATGCFGEPEPDGHLEMENSDLTKAR